MNPTIASTTTNDTVAPESITRFYVAHHQTEVLQKCEPPPGSGMLHLPSLPIPRMFSVNKYAESRALLWMALNPSISLPNSGYVALFQGSYPTKFAHLPKLNELPEYLAPALKPDVVVSPVVCKDYMNQSRSCHPGMDLAIERVINRVGIPWVNGRAAPMCNSIVAHHSVWRRFLSDWLRMFVAAQDECEILSFCIRICKPGVEAAYLLERMTTAWFAAQDDLRCASIVGKSHHIYEPLYPQITVW